MPEQRVLADVFQGAADIGVGDFQAIGAFTQVHGVVVVGQADFEPQGIVQLQRGFVGDPGGAGLQALRIAGGVKAVGGTRIVVDLVARKLAGRLIGGFAVTEVKRVSRSGLTIAAKLAATPLPLPVLWCW